MKRYVIEREIPGAADLSQEELAAIAPLGEYDRYTLLKSTTMGGLLRQLIDLTLEAEELWSAEGGI